MSRIIITGNPFKWFPHTGTALREQHKVHVGCPGNRFDPDPRSYTMVPTKFDRWHRRGTSPHHEDMGKLAPRPDPYLVYWRSHPELYKAYMAQKEYRKDAKERHWKPSRRIRGNET